MSSSHEALEISPNWKRKVFDTLGQLIVDTCVSRGKDWHVHKTNGQESFFMGLAEGKSEDGKVVELYVATHGTESYRPERFRIWWWEDGVTGAEKVYTGQRLIQPTPGEPEYSLNRSDNWWGENPTDVVDGGELELILSLINFANPNSSTRY